MSFFITAGSGGGYKSGSISSYNNSNNMLNQMTNAVSGNPSSVPASKNRFKGQQDKNRAPLPAGDRTFKVDPFDY